MKNMTWIGILLILNLDKLRKIDICQNMIENINLT